MDKGIRPAANAKFVELLPTRAEIGNTAFRKNVMFYLMEEFGCTNPAAATHYNHAFQLVKQANPELVVGLGRPEGKNNGGRKKKVVVDTVVADSAPQELCGPVQPESAAEAAEVAEITAALTAPEATVAEVAAATDIVNLYKAKDKSLVQLGIPRAEAEALIAKAAKAKKAALVIA
jgi:hypothetical protein